MRIISVIKKKANYLILNHNLILFKVACKLMKNKNIKLKIMKIDTHYSEVLNAIQRKVKHLKAVVKLKIIYHID